MEKIGFCLNLLFLLLVFWKTRFCKLLPTPELLLCILLVPANENIFCFAILASQQLCISGLRRSVKVRGEGSRMPMAPQTPQPLARDRLIGHAPEQEGRGLVSNTSFLQNKIFSYHILFWPIKKDGLISATKCDSIWIRTWYSIIKVNQ